MSQDSREKSEEELLLQRRAKRFAKMLERGYPSGLVISEVLLLLKATKEMYGVSEVARVYRSMRSREQAIKRGVCTSCKQKPPLAGQELCEDCESKGKALESEISLKLLDEKKSTIQ